MILTIPPTMSILVIFAFLFLWNGSVTEAAYSGTTILDDGRGDEPLFSLFEVSPFEVTLRFPKKVLIGRSNGEIMMAIEQGSVVYLSQYILEALGSSSSNSENTLHTLELDVDLIESFQQSQVRRLGGSSGTLDNFSVQVSGTAAIKDADSSTTEVTQSTVRDMIRSAFTGTKNMNSYAVTLRKAGSGVLGSMISVQVIPDMDIPEDALSILGVDESTPVLPSYKAATGAVFFFGILTLFSGGLYIFLHIEHREKVRHEKEREAAAGSVATVDSSNSFDDEEMQNNTIAMTEENPFLPQDKARKETSAPPHPESEHSLPEIGPTSTTTSTSHRSSSGQRHKRRKKKSRRNKQLPSASRTRLHSIAEDDSECDEDDDISQTWTSVCDSESVMSFSTAASNDNSASSISNVSDSVHTSGGGGGSRGTSESQRSRFVFSGLDVVKKDDTASACVSKQSDESVIASVASGKRSSIRSSSRQVAPTDIDIAAVDDLKSSSTAPIDISELIASAPHLGVNDVMHRIRQILESRIAQTQASIQQLEEESRRSRSRRSDKSGKSSGSNRKQKKLLLTESSSRVKETPPQSPASSSVDQAPSELEASLKEELLSLKNDDSDEQKVESSASSASQRFQVSSEQEVVQQEMQQEDLSDDTSHLESEEVELNDLDDSYDDSDSKTTLEQRNGTSVDISTTSQEGSSDHQVNALVMTGQQEKREEDQVEMLTSCPKETQQSSLEEEGDEESIIDALSDSGESDSGSLTLSLDEFSLQGGPLLAAEERENNQGQQQQERDEGSFSSRSQEEEDSIVESNCTTSPGSPTKEQLENTNIFSSSSSSSTTATSPHKISPSSVVDYDESVTSYCSVSSSKKNGHSCSGGSLSSSTTKGSSRSSRIRHQSNNIVDFSESDDMEAFMLPAPTATSTN